MSYEDEILEWQEQLASIGIDPHLVELGKARELAGRDEFGDAWMNRDNVAEGGEEGADFINYAFFKVLQRREEGRDGRMDLALIAAHKIHEAFDALKRLEDAP